MRGAGGVINGKRCMFRGQGWGGRLRGRRAGHGASTMKPVLAVFAATVVSAAAQVVHLDPAAAELVAADAKIEKLGGGMKFTEGPVWVPSRKALIFSDIPSAKLMKWEEGKGVSEHAEALNPNGNVLDRDGRLVTCEHSGRRVIRVDADGKKTVLATEFGGKKLSSPNDAVVKKDGTIWFTDPHYGVPAGEKKEQEVNRVYRLDPGTGKVTAVSELFDMPNGLAFSPDEKTLYIADSGKPQRVGAFPVKDDGSLGEPKFWMSGGSDGLRTDVQGNVYTTASDGVRIYNPEGKQLARITLPEQPANCTFGGSDYRTLFVTARTSLYAIPLKVAGNDQR
jgi:gluconolactonase